MASFQGFSIAGIRINIDPSWFIAFVLFAWTLSAGYFPMQAPDYPAGIYWFFGTVSTLALFGSVLVHELSHSLVARRLGVPVRRITLFIFGGVSEMDQTHSNTPGSEFRITIAGPLASIGIGVVFGLLALAVRGFADRMVTEALNYIWYINFLLAAFNLIPGFPLDGGRVLRSWLWHRSGDFGQATRSASRIGSAFGAGLMLLGVLSFVRGFFMAGIWLGIVGMFLKRSAEHEYQSYRIRNALGNVSVGDVMTPPIAVPLDLSAAEFVNDYVFRYHHRSFPVVDDGHFAGMIEVKTVKAIPSDKWPWTRIRNLLSEQSAYCVLDPAMAAPAALQVLLVRGCAKAPVVRDGLLLGILTRTDLYKVISIKGDLAA